MTSNKRSKTKNQKRFRRKKEEFNNQQKTKSEGEEPRKRRRSMIIHGENITDQSHKTKEERGPASKHIWKERRKNEKTVALKLVSELDANTLPFRFRKQQIKRKNEMHMYGIAVRKLIGEERK